MGLFDRLRKIFSGTSHIGDTSAQSRMVMSTDELKSHILDITLIDVRDPHSYKAGHIQGAQNIPLESLKEEFKERYNTNEKNIVVYGEDDNMGNRATQVLEDTGYKNVKIYKAGFQEWRHARLPIKRIDMGQERRE